MPKPISDEVLIDVQGVSKKFCRDLKKSLWYGIQDVAGSPVARELNDPDQSRSPRPPKKTLSYTGEGIGLTIVKRLCEVLDAGISLESELGKGTTVRIQFPLI